MRKIELGQVYSKYNFAKRFIMEYMQKIFQEYLDGQSRPQSAQVLEVLSSALKGINSSLASLDDICEEEAQKFFEKRYKDVVFSSIVQFKKDAHWSVKRLNIYPNSSSVNASQLHYVKAIFYASRANEVALRNAEIETVKLLRDNQKLPAFDLPIMQFYTTLTNQDELFFLSGDVDLQYNEVFNVLSAELDKGKIYISASKPTNYLKTLKENINLDFMHGFKDYNQIATQNDELAEKYIALASDAWNDAFEKIKARKISQVKPVTT